MNDSCRQRRTERSDQILQCFSDCSLSRLAFQDEKDFTVQVKTNRQNNHVYIKGRKYDVEPRKLFNAGNKFSVKVIVSATVTWK